MNDDELTERMTRGIEVTRSAGAMALDYFRRRGSLEIEHKGRQDLVSIADRNVEEHIRAELARSFPDDAFLGEEGGGGEAPRVWVIDPIDGTFNFLHGLPCWAVTMAFVADGVPEIGLTYDPVHDEMFTARRGHGARCNGEPVRVSSCADPADALIALTYSFKIERAPYLQLMDALLRQGCEHRRGGSTAVMLNWVADGRCDGLVALQCNSWDVLGGLLIVQEAGGQATDFVGRHGLTAPGGVIACTPGLRHVLEQAASLEL